MPTNETLDVTSIDFIPGMPPSQPQDDTIGSRTNTVVKNSMPLVRIYPGIPSFTQGTSLFTRRDLFSTPEGKYSSYLSLLQEHKYSLNPNVHQNCLTLAYIADSFPTDSFTNEYGENFLQGITDVAATTSASVAQMFGIRSAKEGAGRMADALKKNDWLRKYVEIGEKGARKGAEVINNLPIVGGVSNAVDSLLAGSRLDFPMLWKSSGFQPSYTMTIRLYNPNPGSKESTKKYIGGPLAAILLLGLPISNDGSTFSWPFIHKIWSPGIYDLDPAFISNITVIKGGDQQQIGYTQRLGVVDVRIDFGSLFSNILVTKTASNNRPTLKKYLDTMVGDDGQKPGVENFSSVGQTPDEIAETQKKQSEALSPNPSAITKNKILNRTATMARSALNATTASLRGQVSTAINNRELPSLDQIRNLTINTGVEAAKSQAPTLTELTFDQIQNPNDRVSSTLRNIASDLEAKIPSGIKI